MMEQNIGIWLWRPDGPMRFSDHPLLFSLNGIGGFAGPLFITLAGISAALFVRQKTDVDRTLMLRGVGIMFFGYAMNLLTPGFFCPGSWFTLHMIGFAILLTPVFRRLRNTHILLAAVIITLTTGLLHHYLNTPMKLSSFHMSSLKHPGGVLRLMLVEGHYPVFPWLAFFLGGFLAGRLFIEDQQRRMLQIAFVSLILSGILLIPAILPDSLPNQRPWSLFLRLNLGSFPTPPLFVLLFYPLVIFTFLLCRTIAQRTQMKRHHFLVSLGRMSLTLQIVHVVLFYEVFQRLRWFRSFSTVETLSILAGVLALTAFLSTVWRKYDFRFGCEWILRRITDNPWERREVKPFNTVKRVSE